MRADIDVTFHGVLLFTLIGNDKTMHKALESKGKSTHFNHMFSPE